jgi:hypothetical protein
MTAAQFVQLDEVEAEAVMCWRLDMLMRAGYDAADAVVLALQVEIDLHVATALISRGCPSETALRILL